MTNFANNNIEWAVLLSRVVRWSFGILIIWLGFRNDYDWAVIIFGALMFITGFFRPRRCVGEICNMQNASGKK